MRTIDEQVREFHRTMGVTDRDSPGAADDKTMRLRMRLIVEEVFEFLEACSSSSVFEILHHRAHEEIMNCILNPNIVAIADALGDIDYVVAGTRLQLGIPGEAVADEIHRSNMAKAPGGVVRRNEYGKVVKPDDWTPPDIAKVLGVK